MDKPERLKEYAANGDVYAMHQLGAHYCCGTMPGQDNAEGTEWLCKAARKSFVQSELALAELYDPDKETPSGEAVPKDPLRAIMWYSLAARQGKLDAIEARNRLHESLSDDEKEQIAPMMNRWKAVPCGIKEEASAASGERKAPADETEEQKQMKPKKRRASAAPN